jgi:ATP-dependent Lhr-like helicase
LTAFTQLNPALQHHIVNSLGWRELRPFQESAIPPILAGRHMLVIAPTAGGKTEASIFPLLSRMLDEDWRRLSVLYICPIKALLNNLEPRLDRYFSLVGRRFARWHGDVSPSVRRRILRDPPDGLLTTPESLEVMLTSRNVDHRLFFADIQAVVLDEVHAFAGDDRGWHLLAVLERIARIAGREIQRIGLSATVGNPDELARWLRGGFPGLCEVQTPASSGQDSADVTVDFVGSLENAALVISRLHRGEKRLVFTDSRSKAERLGALLRQREVTVFVTHGSLGVDQRRQAERAFAERDDCVIVATSVLELGVDVGDLDRAIQIDAPATVSAFLQRMGRTGRRAETGRNYLFLATSEAALLHAAALVQLWADGLVEPLRPPPIPFHVFAQQIMALALQEGGIGTAAWKDWIGRFAPLAELDEETVAGVLRHMLSEDILWNDQGILWFGREGENAFGRRHFMEVLSMVSGEPLFTVQHGSQEIGRVHPLSFSGAGEEAPVVLLAGRSWKIGHIDWRRKIAFAEPAKKAGRSQWLGAGLGLGREISRGIRLLLVNEEVPFFWSRRAAEKIGELRDRFSWLPGEGTVLETNPKGVHWWTFAGAAVNRVLARLLKVHLGISGHPDGLGVLLRNPPSPKALSKMIPELRSAWESSSGIPVDDELLDGLKFSRCLGSAIGRRVVERRLCDPEEIGACLREPPRRTTNVADSSVAEMSIRAKG